MRWAPSVPGEPADDPGEERATGPPEPLRWHGERPPERFVEQGLGVHADEGEHRGEVLGVVESRGEPMGKCALIRGNVTFTFGTFFTILNKRSGTFPFPSPLTPLPRKRGVEAGRLVRWRWWNDWRLG